MYMCCGNKSMKQVWCITYVINSHYLRTQQTMYCSYVMKIVFTIRDILIVTAYGEECQYREMQPAIVYCWAAVCLLCFVSCLCNVLATLWKTFFGFDTSTQFLTNLSNLNTINNTPLASYMVYAIQCKVVVNLAKQIHLSIFYPDSPKQLQLC